MKDGSLLVLDTETTGLDEPQIIELGYIRLEGLEALDIIEEFQRRYKPDKPSELGALMTHNIMESELVDCDSYKTAIIPEEVDYVVGHNIDYDIGAFYVKPDIKTICTKAIARHFLPELDSHRQSALLYYFEGEAAREKLINAHSALTDAMNCRLLLGHLLDYIAEEKGIPRKDMDFAWLYSLSEFCRGPTIFSVIGRKGEKIKADNKTDRGYISWGSKQDFIGSYLKKGARE